MAWNTPMLAFFHPSCSGLSDSPAALNSASLRCCSWADILSVVPSGVDGALIHSLVMPRVRKEDIPLLCLDSIPEKGWSNSGQMSGAMNYWGRDSDAEAAESMRVVLCLVNSWHGQMLGLLNPTNYNCKKHCGRNTRGLCCLRCGQYPRSCKN